MFKQLLFLAVLMFIPPLSFAQIADHTFETSIEEGQIYIIVQIEIRDSNQNLAGYIETDRITVLNFEELSLILDDMSANSENTKIIIIDDKKYQIITGIGDAQYASDTTVSLSGITNDGESLAYANYGGFPVKSGDSVLTTWTMIRPA
ncbi:hypothetical protein OAL59_02560 [Nitrosopumilus sp.]|nr:hypothetical protein [Nitrosopumilus sp.]